VNCHGASFNDDHKQYVCGVVEMMVVELILVVVTLIDCNATLVFCQAFAYLPLIVFF